ncbi:hypothetical protein FRC08_011616 [Ceratobasidium sp. 394]|nr:hypothetical protein FRC08_011616 [Ceratobasidium sp. 394]
MKYASVVIPLVVVGVLFLCGCVWVAMRTRNDDGDGDGDEESVVGEPSAVLACCPKETILPPARAQTVERPVPPVPVSTLPLPARTSQASETSRTSETLPPPRYER